MRFAALRQNEAIDVTHWEEDSEYGVFPQGARDKFALIAPSDSGLDFLIPGHRYLFKLSRNAYPDQFWGEVIAYRIGCLLGVEVPPAFAAWNQKSGQCGALIEWFYADESGRLVHAGDYLQLVRPEFDRTRGEMHNLRDVEVLMRVLVRGYGLGHDWRMWWMRTLIFDSLIGNSDRHQENWGFVIEAKFGGLEPEKTISTHRMAPAFDNGTSLGNELFTHKTASWDRARVAKYIQQGRHHIKFDLSEGVKNLNHFALLNKLLSEWDDIDKEQLRRMVDIDTAELCGASADLQHLDLPEPLSTQRIKFANTLLIHRLEILKELLRD